MKPFEKRFQRLLKRFIRGEAVPFLGAGVSASAEFATPVDGDPRPTSVAWMRDALITKLDEVLSGNDTRRDQRSRRLRLVLAALVGPDKMREPGDLVEACANVTDLGRVAEVVGWVIGEEAVQKVIGLDLLTKLEPCLGHQYLAYLAREGLVTEIITTNFDTCLEKAYRRTFGPLEQVDGNPCCPAVVCRLPEYRQYGGKLWERIGGQQRPVLKLYKINGCAEQRQPKGPTEDGCIQLTERQLHSFRKQPWTEHLFCDRARCRSLVFNGFGSDEPQIRHTVLTLCEEFATPGARIK